MLFCPCSPARELRRFKRHADDTNDIFHVAARAVAGTCLRAQHLLDDRCALISFESIGITQHASGAAVQPIPGNSRGATCCYS